MTPKHLPKKVRQAKIAEEKKRAGASAIVRKAVETQLKVAKRLVEAEEKAVRMVRAKRTLSEQRFNVALTHPRTGAHLRLEGTMDEVEETDEGAVITEVKQWRGDAEARTHPQLLLYAAAYSVHHGRLPARLVLRGLSDRDPLSTYTPTQDDVDGVLARLWTLVDTCTEGHFVARPSPPACGRCNYASLCPAAARASPQFDGNGEQVQSSSRGAPTDRGNNKARKKGTHKDKQKSQREMNE